MRNNPARRLLSLAASLPREVAQNRLMRIADRELAVAMMFMDDRERERLLLLLAPAKARRVREELVIQKHITVSYDQYLVMVDHAIGVIENEGRSESLRSYLRPRRSVPRRK